MPSRSASDSSIFAFSISSLNFRIFEIDSFSSSQWILKALLSSESSANFLFIRSRRLFETLSLSFLTASRSISNCWIFLSTSSSSSGLLSISIRRRDAASSIRSMALSGRNRSVIYLFERTAACIMALSSILTPWCTSYFSFNPRSMEIVFSTEGSGTIIGWNLLSSAASFSIYFLYSVIVVAPIHRSSPRANAGFNIFDASTAPSAEPAPTSVWSSSINNIIEPSASVISLITAFKRSSNSPLNFAPAISEPISRAAILLDFRFSGTSPAIIL